MSCSRAWRCLRSEAASAFHRSSGPIPRRRPAQVNAVGVTQEAVNLNPLLYVNTGVETCVEFLVFDSLWKIDPEGKFIPNLATEIPTVENGGISKDGLTWTIKLRPDVTWHDGQPFTADDVAFTLDVIMNPKVTVRSREGHEHVEHYAARDSHTIEIKLKESFAPYLVSWQKTSVIPKHILSTVPDINTASFNTNPVGTGPFKLKERVAGSYIAFAPNPKYHGGAPKLISLIQKYVPDQQTLFAQLQTGEVDVYDIQGIPPLLYQRAKALPQTKVLLNPNPFVEFIYFNCGKPQFQDKRVRKALYMAVDRKGWIDAVYYGVPVPTLSYLPPNHWAYNKRSSIPATIPRRRRRSWTRRAGRWRATGCAPRTVSASPSPGRPPPATSRASRRSSSNRTSRRLMSR
jgi:peptide/nickel transport system substrate-binding protein